MSTLQGCLPHNSVFFTGVFTLQISPRYRGVYLTKVSLLQECLPHNGISYWEVGVLTLKKRLLYRGVYLTIGFPVQDCQDDRDVHATGVFVVEG